MSKIQSLKIPVNQDYDFAQEPSDQPEYANPVTTAYKQVYFSNYAAEITANLNKANAMKAETAVQIRHARNDLEDFEQDLLARFPAPTADRKSNKLLESYVRRVAFESGGQELHQQLIKKVRELEDQLIFVDAKIENGRQAHSMLKMMSEMCKTYLAFYKHEEQQHRYGS